MLLQLDAEVVGEPVYTGRGRPSAWRRANSHQFQITGLAATWPGLRGRGPQPDRGVHPGDQ